MNCSKASELISSAIDGRLDEAQLKIFHQHINICETCRTEFEFTKVTKLLIKNRVKPLNSPEYLFQKIINEINNTGKDFQISTIWKPQFIAVPFLAVIILYILIFSPFSEYSNLSTSSDNIIHQVYNSYNAVAEGKIEPAMLTSDPSVLRSYIKEHMPHIEIPNLKNCSLIGGTLSDYNNHKVLHIMFKYEKCIICFFLIDFRVFYKKETSILPQKVVNKLLTTGLYSADEHKDCSVILWLKDSTLYIAAAKMNKDNLMAFLPETEAQ